MQNQIHTKSLHYMHDKSCSIRFQWFHSLSWRFFLSSFRCFPLLKKRTQSQSTKANQSEQLGRRGGEAALGEVEQREVRCEAMQVRSESQICRIRPYSLSLTLSLVDRCDLIAVVALLMWCPRSLLVPSVKLYPPTSSTSPIGPFIMARSDSSSTSIRSPWIGRLSCLLCIVVLTTTACALAVAGSVSGVRGINVQQDDSNDRHHDAPFGYRTVKTYHSTVVASTVSYLTHPNDFLAMVPEEHRPMLGLTAAPSPFTSPSSIDSTNLLTQAAGDPSSVAVAFSNHSHAFRHGGGHVARQFDGMRDSMLNTKWMGDTKGSSANSMSFLRNFPRQKPDGSSGHNQLQRLGGPSGRPAETAAEEDPIADYVAGLFFMWGVPVLFAIIALICWFGFCLARCWCNVCGRHATKLYTDRQIYWNYLFTCLLITIMGVCCAFGWTGNVQVSQGVDKGFTAADLIANYGYEFMGIFSTAYAINYDAILLGRSFNLTLSFLPSDASITAARNCTSFSTTALDAQHDFVAELRAFASHLSGNARFAKANLDVATGIGSVADSQDSLSEPTATTPVGGIAGASVLENLRHHLVTLNASIVESLPTASEVDSWLTDVGTLQSFSNAGSTAASARTLASVYEGLYASSVTSNLVPDLVSLVHSSSQPLDSAYATQLGCPTSGTGTSTSTCTLLDTALTLTNSSARTMPNWRNASRDAYTSVLQALAAIDSSILGGTSEYAARTTGLLTNLVALNASVNAFGSSLTNYQTSTSTAYWPASHSAYTSVSTSTVTSRFQTFTNTFGPVLQHVLVESLPRVIVSVARMKVGVPRALLEFNTTAWQRSDLEAYVDTVALQGEIRTFNATLTELTCLASLFDMFALVNSTFVILPSSMTTVYNKLAPLVTAQVEGMPIMYQLMNSSLYTLDKVNISIYPDEQPDYAALTTNLTNFMTIVNSMSNLTTLWSELYQLHTTLYAVTGTYPILVNRTSDAAYNASRDTILFNDITQITRGIATSVTSTGQVVSVPDGVGSWLQPLSDIYPRVRFATELVTLNNILQQSASLLSGSLSSSAVTRQVTCSSDLNRERAQLETVLRDLIAALALMPDGSAALTNSQRDLAYSALTQYQRTLVLRPEISSFRDGLRDLNTTLLTPNPTMQDMREKLISLNGLLNNVLPNSGARFRSFQTNATLARQVSLGLVLASPPDQLTALQDGYDALGTLVRDNNQIVQAKESTYELRDMNAIIYALDQPTLAMSPADESTIVDNLDRLLKIRPALPNFDDKIVDGESALEAVGSALTWMEEKKQSYRKHKTDFKRTVDNYDGVRLLLFNLGVLLPFALSFFILVSAIQHYGCPAMIAGLVFFPLFALFMAMAAIQMPIAVALSDHCYNTTGEIKIQTEGRVRITS